MDGTTSLHARLPSLLGELRVARSFEEAAESVVRAMLGLAGDALGASRFARRGRMLRGMVHLRPEGGYRSLVVVDLASAGEGAAAPHMPSATAWRWIAKHRAAVSIDVHVGRVHIEKEEAPELVEEPGHALLGFDSQESAERLMSREATHLYAAPLRARRGAALGMISLEAGCQAAMGQEFVFRASSRALQILADVAAPYLSTLPLRPAPAPETDELLPVVGAAMAGVVQMAKVFAQQDETILIGGPTGAGKSRLARWCHERSRRRGRPFEVLDLLTVPEDLQMAELFGWRKGAFTGAVKDSQGAMGLAEGGTLFIDEIDKLSLRAQAGLLHVLEERTYRALGDDAGGRRADVRFIIGTNADLFEAVQEGRFREDLYYRINVLPIRVPALDERPDEISLWARYMAARRHREASPDGSVRLSNGAERLLAEQRWPGNLRQLDNIVRRAYALALMDRGGAEGEVVFDEGHVARALGYERGARRRSLVEAMRTAGAAFVAEAEGLALRGEALDLDLVDAFRGFVLGAAVQKLGSREAAYRLFGKGAQVENRNHHKAFRRALERASALCEALGGADASPFADLLDGEDP